ncbi:unnamed protein product [Ilex paraguariensis]|uniref:Uncharacterized protein n=1 Tax=Ilex paraguariensis TaxID=185542 RepID=A0ABC8SFJ4_9AQUA
MVGSISISRNPNSLVPQSTSGDPPPPPTYAGVTAGGGGGGGGGGFLALPKRPPIRVTSEFDSDSSIFFHKISCKFFDSLAKLKLSFQNDKKGEISEPQLVFKSKYLSLNYEFEEHNALVEGFFDFAPGLQLRAVHDVKVVQKNVLMKKMEVFGPCKEVSLNGRRPMYYPLDAVCKSQGAPLAPQLVSGEGTLMKCVRRMPWGSSSRFKGAHFPPTVLVHFKG